MIYVDDNNQPHSFLGIAKQTQRTTSVILSELATLYVRPFHSNYRQKLEINYLLIAAKDLCPTELDLFVTSVYRDANEIIATARYTSDETTAPDAVITRQNATLQSFADMLLNRNHVPDVFCNAKNPHGLPNQGYAVKQYLAIIEQVAICLNVNEYCAEARWMAEAHREQIFAKTEEFIAALRYLVRAPSLAATTLY